MQEEPEDQEEESQASMALIAMSIILAWTAIGGAVAWACSTLFPLYVDGANISLYLVCVVYLMLSVIAAIIIKGLERKKTWLKKHLK